MNRDRSRGPHRQARRRRSSALSTALLIVVAVFGPIVAYAGIQVIYPQSTLTADIDTTPPITFAAGADHATANSVGFAGSFTEADNAAGFTLSVNGLSGGNITIDDLVTITKDATVSSYKLEIGTAYSGSLTPDVFAIRLWTGDTAPNSDAHGSVCAVLDLLGSGETSNACSGTTVKVQVIYELPSGASSTGSVSIRPSSIVFA